MEEAVIGGKTAPKWNGTGADDYRDPVVEAYTKANQVSTVEPEEVTGPATAPKWNGTGVDDYEDPIVKYATELAKASATPKARPANRANGDSFYGGGGKTTNYEKTVSAKPTGNPNTAAAKNASEAMQKRINQQSKEPIVRALIDAMFGGEK